MTVPPNLARSVLTPAQKQAAARVLASRAMTRAPRLGEVLGHIIRCVDEGRQDEISEHSIGVQVFQRPTGYNSSEDNIVRVTVRHLRSRLEEYYRDEGANDPVEICIPKGSYVPVFRTRTRPINSALVEPMRIVPKPGERLHPGWILSLFLGLACVALGWLHWSTAVAPSKGLIQTLLLRDGGRLNVVVTDSKLQAYRVIFNRVVPLKEYTEQKYLLDDRLPQEPMLLDSVRNFLRGAPDTSASSLQSASLLARVGAPGSVRVRHPRDMRMRDLETDSTILLGGPWINPWGQLFEERLNFQMIVREHASGSQVRNVSPQAGEWPLYRPSPEGTLNLNYARVALVPGLSPTSRVMLIGATSGDAIEAACQFLSSPVSLDRVRRLFGKAEGEQVTFFELLLEVKGMAETPKEVRVLAHRTSPPKQ